LAAKISARSSFVPEAIAAAVLASTWIAPLIARTDIGKSYPFTHILQIYLKPFIDKSLNHFYPIMKALEEEAIYEIRRTNP
jgi:hypothetical protein